MHRIANRSVILALSLLTLTALQTLADDAGSFDQIKVGMTMEQVEKLLGGSGTEDSAPPGLTISGAGGTYTTSQCFQQMPGVSRVSHSSGQRGWSTRCTSAAGDPRRGHEPR